MTNCPFSGRCSSEGYLCSSCQNNADVKKDYYVPMNPWHLYYPYYPTTTPYVPLDDITITCGTDSQNKGSVVIYAVSLDKRSVTDDTVVRSEKLKSKMQSY